MHVSKVLVSVPLVAARTDSYSRDLSGGVVRGFAEPTAKENEKFDRSSQEKVKDENGMAEEWVPLFSFFLFFLFLRVRT